MKAVLWTKYGSPDSLELKEITEPVPNKNEVCIRVYATTVVAGDCEMRSLSLSFLLSTMVRLMNGVTSPKRFQLLGQEFSGEIDSIGSDVSQFKVGDKVFGATGFGHGTYSEYICLPEDSPDDVFIKNPAQLSFDTAAALAVGSLEALHFLRQANIKRHDTILINGAGGSIGTAAVQLAKIFGAEVTAVDKLEKLPMLQSIGADHIIDYKHNDFSDKHYDIIFDIPGKTPYKRLIQSLKPGGLILLANPNFATKLRSLIAQILSNKKTFMSTSRRSRNDLIYIRSLVESQKFYPVIDQYFTLEQMAEAHRYVDSGQKQGNVVITVC
ncbi:NAD(P)-dependent alcohol dehydrogenase [Eubacteriaceae bacterium ES3]|nr:NAD(P)-dependent alcohol dehydrogenase [Eubacteriaceae bacterium ES3]